MKRSSMPCASHHSVKALEVSSLPLSSRIAFGLPYMAMSCSITRITRRAGLEGAISMPSPSRLPFDHIHRPERAPPVERVGHQVERPYLVETFRRRQGLP